MGEGRGESLRSIHQAYQDTFSYESLRIHCQKHQFLSEEDFKERHLNKIAKTAEKQLLKRQIESVTVWEDVITKGMEGLEDGSIRVSANHLLKAAKDKSDYEMKKKDQEYALAQMVMFFASGESEQSRRRPYDRRVAEGRTVTDFDPATGVADNTDEGEDGPSTIYYPPTWDAPTSGPSQISQGHDETQDQD